MILDGVKLRISNYKSFSSEGTVIDVSRPVTVVIGRNNSGKSALVDSIALACEPADIHESRRHGNGEPSIVITKPLLEAEVAPVFRHSVSQGDFPGGASHWDLVGQHIVGCDIEYKLTKNGTTVSRIDIPARLKSLYSHVKFENYCSQFNSNVINPFKNLLFRRLLADRDVNPEGDTGTLSIEPNGHGLTSTIAQILNRSYHPSDLVEAQMLEPLNSVFYPDAIFTSILVQLHGDEKWEIYLTEEKKGRISLSNSGSGLKTVLLLCSYLILVPYIEKKELDKFYFSFEELENNLHPAMQRRLLTYIRNAALKDKFHVLITTHSSAVIDLFSSDAEAQIVHVTHCGVSARARTVSTYIDNHGVLDDLDVRASDLLQANGIVWVEGPSDRLYFNRWVSLWSEGAIQEGLQYQCVFYGGRLLAHLTASDPNDNIANILNIFRVNRNGIILIDSDKKSASSRLNETKKRLIAEFGGMNGFAWITKGREVENYIPHHALQTVAGNSAPILSQFEDIGIYLEAHQGSASRKKFERGKVLFAERVLPVLSKENLSNVLDLSDQMDRTIKTLR